MVQSTTLQRRQSLDQSEANKSMKITYIHLLVQQIQIQTLGWCEMQKLWKCQFVRPDSVSGCVHVFKHQGVVG